MHGLIKLFVALFAIAILGTVGLVLLAWRPALDPIEPSSAPTFAAAEIAHGKAMAGAGNCQVCHTVTNSPNYAGGRGLATPFGTVYSTNITPDPQTGIGRWSEAAFVRAMREGVGPQGQHYYPVFPYTHFTLVDDADLHSLYAYFMSLPAASAAAPSNSIAFPLNWRPLLAGWKLLFFTDQRFSPSADRDEQYNRGAYLAEGLGHCSACHTPRNILGAEKNSATYAGAMVDEWYAPPLTAVKAVVGQWSRRELFDYLRVGASRYHGVAVGSMSEVIHVGLHELPDTDIAALAAYFADQPQAGTTAGDTSAEAAASNTNFASAGRMHPDGERIFDNACASCHYNQARNPQLLRPELSINSAISAPTASNLIRVVLQGVGRDEGLPRQLMPGFATSLGDAELVAVAEYLRATVVEQTPWQDLDTAVASARKQLRDQAKSPPVAQTRNMPPE